MCWAHPFLEVNRQQLLGLQQVGKTPQHNSGAGVIHGQGNRGVLCSFVTPMYDAAMLAQLLKAASPLHTGDATPACCAILPVQHTSGVQKKTRLASHSTLRLLELEATS